MASIPSHQGGDVNHLDNLYSLIGKIIEAITQEFRQEEQPITFIKRCLFWSRSFDLLLPKGHSDSIAVLIPTIFILESHFRMSADEVKSTVELLSSQVDIETDFIHQ